MGFYTDYYLRDNPNIHVATIASFVADMHSPIHREPGLRLKYGLELFRIGDMTTEFGYTVNGLDVRDEARSRCSSSLASLYEHRPDLALTSLLNDELRFILAAQFGNTFAKEAMLSLRTDEGGIRQSALRRGIDERIIRTLEQ